MTLNEIYQEYTPGSTGFCVAVETHCGFAISRTEIERIAARATDAAQFETIWENDADWVDPPTCR